MMQNWWSLTDDAMENALIDGNAICGFAGIDLAKDNIPAEGWQRTTHGLGYRPSV